MSYDALRKGRHSLHHQVYCITTVTRDRQPLFADLTTVRLLAHQLRLLHESKKVTSLAWVIMPDHLHWLIQLNGPAVGSNSFDQSNSTTNSSRPNKFGPTNTHQPRVGSNSFDRSNSTPNSLRPNKFGPTNTHQSLHEPWPLSRIVKTLKARSARAINRHLGRSGSLWQRAYYDRAARKDEDIRQIARYIIANPLRAGLAQNIGDYPHWDCIWMDPL